LLPRQQLPTPPQLLRRPSLPAPQLPRRLEGAPALLSRPAALPQLMQGARLRGAAAQVGVAGPSAPLSDGKRFL
jgi:hypothetical protein